MAHFMTIFQGINSRLAQNLAWKNLEMNLPPIATSSGIDADSF